MEENRTQALERLLGQLNSFDLFPSSFDSDKAFTPEGTSVLQTFLENPDRHAEEPNNRMQRTAVPSAADAALG